MFQINRKYDRMAYLGVEGWQGCYRLPINTLKAYRDKDVLTFVKQIGMTRLFPGLDSRLLGLLLTQQPHAPCLIWHHAHKISVLHADHFYQLVYAITSKQSISLLTLRMKDRQGKVLGDAVLEVDPFGDTSASRATFTGLEIPCEDIAEFEVVKAVEDQNGRKVELPLSIFQANNPELAKMSISGK